MPTPLNPPLPAAVRKPPPPSIPGKEKQTSATSLLETFPSHLISMEPKEANNRITEVVRLQQMLKKWKKLAVAPKSNSKKGIKFLKKTLSFSDTRSALSSDVPKGFLAVCVGDEMKRFVIPTEYLSHRAFGLLLREAEEEFGFEQEGVLRIPCEVPVFESILKIVGGKKKKESSSYCSSELGISHRPQKPMRR